MIIAFWRTWLAFAKCNCGNPNRGRIWCGVWASWSSIHNCRRGQQRGRYRSPQWGCRRWKGVPCVFYPLVEAVGKYNSAFIWTARPKWIQSTCEQFHDAILCSWLAKISFARSQWPFLAQSWRECLVGLLGLKTVRYLRYIRKHAVKLSERHAKDNWKSLCLPKRCTRYRNPFVIIYYSYERSSSCASFLLSHIWPDQIGTWCQNGNVQYPQAWSLYSPFPNSIPTVQ